MLRQFSYRFSSQLEEACLISQGLAKSRGKIGFVMSCVSMYFLAQDGV